MPSESFFDHYLAYTSGGETPTFFNRWCAITGLGAYLGRDYYFRHGHFNVNPNLYVMLIGAAGTRKSTSILMMKQLLQKAGYKTIAANKTSKEKFLLDLADSDIHTEHGAGLDSMMEAEIFGSSDSETYKQVLIAADEFNLFLGLNNMEFISLLGVLWDYNGVYENKIKTGKSNEIPNPTVSILSGNTPTGFSQAFPPEVIGQGFFSRLLLVYGEPNGRRITFQREPDESETVELIARLHSIRAQSRGRATLTDTAKSLIDKIYQSGVGVDDLRFESYNSRRLTHLLKICLIFSASYGSATITEHHVVYANTVLSHTEHLMPKALGEFGKARNSDVTNKVMTLINSTTAGLKLKDIWPHVSNDLESLPDLAKILTNLVAANKIQNVASVGFLPIRRPLVEHSNDTVDYSLLTPEEQDLI